MFSLIDDILAAHTKAVDPASVVDLVTGMNQLSSVYAYGDVETLARVYEKISWAYRSIFFLASNIARVPLILYRKKQDGTLEPIQDSKRFQVFDKANAWQTWKDFTFESVVRLLMQGELFWEMQLSNLGYLDAMYADWRSEEVEIVKDPKAYIVGYKRTVNGKKIPFDVDEVVYIKYLNPYNAYRGLSPLRAARDAIILDVNAVAYNKNFFKQGLKMGGVIETERSIRDVNEAKRIRETFAEMYQGNDAMHKIGVLWGGFKFTPLNTMSMQDIQFKELREMNREEIVAVYGLSMEALGVGHKTYENVKYYRRMAWTETIIPLLDKIVDAINIYVIPKLVSKNEQVVVKPDLSSIEALKEDRSQKVKDYTVGVKLGALTRNEMRQDVFGKDKIDDPEMETPVVFGNTLKLDVDEIDDMVKKKFLVYDISPTTYENRTKIWQIKIKKIERLAPRVEKAMTKFFNEQKREVIERAVAIYGKTVKGDLVETSVVFDMDKWVEKLHDLGLDMLIPAVEAGGQEIIDLIQAGGEFDVTLPEVRAALGVRVNEFSRFVNETTDKKIKQVINEALQDTVGQSQEQIAEAIKTRLTHLFDEMTPTRARTIARTETVAANNLGVQEGMRQAKVQRKMWITSRDDRVRDSHQIDGQVVGVDQSFMLRDGRMMPYPMDINERCVHIPTTEPITAQ